MSYKGNDLDLRTPYALNEEAGSLPVHSALAELERDGPIPVDQTVLACCNAAYDAAVFHGSRDVRLEHLVYALTRVDAARDVLEQHGVGTQQLRRDTAAAIAADSPAAATGRRSPRVSAEMENILRRAAGRARQDSVPASVHDVMRALLSTGRDLPATSLLLRAANDTQLLERWAAEAMPPPPAHPAPGLQPALTQEVAMRLESLETAVRTLAGEVAADRKAMLDMMGEIQHELRAAREEIAGPPPAIVLEKIDDVGRSLTSLSDRVDSVRALAAPSGTMETRLTALESRLAEQPAAIAHAIGYLLDERRAAEPEPLQLTATDPSLEVSEKLTSLEAMMRGQWERIEEGSRAHERDLTELFEALVKLGSNQQTLAENLEAWRLDNTGDVSIVSNRLQNLEQMLHETIRQEGEDDDAARPGSLKRWLYSTASVLPSTWRPDPAEVRNTIRSARGSQKS